MFLCISVFRGNVDYVLEAAAPHGPEFVGAERAESVWQPRVEADFKC